MLNPLELAALGRFDRRSVNFYTLNLGLRSMPMQIGEIARRTGVSSSRIRFYERRGLLQTADRASNGYRSYGLRDQKIIAFIERAQKLGFTLKEISAFLVAPPDQRSAVSLTPRLEAKLAEIDRHIREARRRRREIANLIEELKMPEASPGSTSGVRLGSKLEIGVAPES